MRTLDPDLIYFGGDMYFPSFLVIMGARRNGQGGGGHLLLLEML